MKKYIAHPKEKSNKIESNKPCALGISVGQEVHENGKLEAALTLAAECNASKVYIILADELQKYSLSMTSNILPEQLSFMSIELGDQWIKRNISTIKAVLDEKRIGFEIIRWKEIVATDRYCYWKDTFNNEKNDSEFSQALDQTVSKYIERQKIKEKFSSLILMQEEIKQRSKQYIVEECAGLVAWTLSLPEKQRPANFVYPQIVIEAFNLTQKKYLNDAMKFVQISIRESSVSAKKDRSGSQSSSPTSFSPPQIHGAFFAPSTKTNSRVYETYASFENTSSSPELALGSAKINDELSAPTFLTNFDTNKEELSVQNCLGFHEASAIYEASLRALIRSGVDPSRSLKIAFDFYIKDLHPPIPLTVSAQQEHNNRQSQP